MELAHLRRHASVWGRAARVTPAEAAWGRVVGAIEPTTPFQRGIHKVLRLRRAADEEDALKDKLRAAFRAFRLYAAQRRLRAGNLVLQ